MQIRVALVASLIVGLSGLTAISAGAGQAASPEPRVATVEAVDPVAVVVGTAAVAKSLSGLLGTWEPDNSVALAKLKPVQDANPKTHDLLRQAVDVLSGYGTGPGTPQRSALESAQDKLRARSDRFYSVYQGELTSAWAAWNAPRKYRTQILGDVKAVGDQLMSPVFGYAPADTVGHAMAIELWIKRRLKHPRTDIKARAGSYLGYLDKALDPSVGSVASKAAALTAQRVRYQKILDEADVKVGSSGWLTVDTWKTERTDTYCRYVTTHTRHTTVRGDQDQGYRVEQSTSSQTIDYCTYGCSGPQCLAASPPAAMAQIMAKESPVPPTDLIPPADGNPVRMKDYWNAVRDARALLDRDIGILTKHLEGIAEYRRFARSVFDNP